MNPRKALHLSLATWLLMAVASGQGYYYSPCQNGQCPPQYAPQQQQPRYDPQPQPQGRTWSDQASDVLVKDNQGHVGSGTVVHSDGRTSYVLTNHHVIRDGQSFNVHTATGAYGAKVVATDPTHDLAVLRVGFSLPAVQVGDAVPQVIVIRSYDNGRLFRRREARILGGIKEPSGYYCDQPVLGGSSGGGVYDQQGRLVGVVWGCADGQAYFTGIGPVRSILLRLGLLGVQVAPLPADNPATDPGPQRQPVQLPPCKCDERFSVFQGTLEQAIANQKAIDARLTKVEASVAMLETTQPIAGKDGKDGRDGKDAVVDLDQLSQAVAEKLKSQPQEPFYIRVRNSKTGTETEYAAVREGDKVTLVFSPDE